MRNVLVAAAFAALLTGQMAAQSAAGFYTSGAFNCRGWLSLSDAGRTGYVIGLLDGYGSGLHDAEIAAASEIPTDKLAFQVGEFVGRGSGQTTGERVSGIGSICRLPENSILPVSFAVQIMAMKINGKTAEEIDRVSARLRTAAASAH